MGARSYIEIGEPIQGVRRVMYGDTPLGVIWKVGSRYHFQAASGEGGSMKRQREAISKLQDYRLRAAVNVLRDSPGRPVSNKHNVPKKSWTRWSRQARRVFNKMMDELRPQMQGIISHPSATLMSKEHWGVVQWNVAFLAATAVNRLR